LETLAAIWKVICLANRVIGKIFSKLRDIPLFDDAINRFENGILNPVVIRRIRNTTDQDLHAALELYEKRISGQFRFQGSDIIRWLANDENIKDNTSRLSG
jgi:hypothetical protein